jgi:hypothetical protein
MGGGKIALSPKYNLMAEIKGTNVASKIVPYTDSDEYATHDEKYGVGGYRTVDSVSEMNAIPAARRKEGMLVYVKGDKIYKLNSSNTFVNAGLGVGEVIDWNSGSNFSQNGYQKFSNGLMLQWGRVGGSSTASYSVTMPTSFYNTEYKIFATVYKPSSDSAVYSSSPLAINKTVSRFYLNRNYASGGTTGLSQESWDWFAIGRWK